MREATNLDRHQPSRCQGSLGCVGSGRNRSIVCKGDAFDRVREDIDCALDSGQSEEARKAGNSTVRTEGRTRPRDKNSPTETLRYLSSSAVLTHKKSRIAKLSN